MCEALFVPSEMEDLGLSEEETAAMVALADLGSDGRFSFQDYVDGLGARMKRVEARASRESSFWDHPNSHRTMSAYRSVPRCTADDVMDAAQRVACSARRCRLALS
eukprot:3934968-Rhodomonas_salina.2